MSDDGRELFLAHVRRFPLLDGLEHERILHDKIEAGVKAHKQLLEKPDLDPEQRRELELTAIIGAGAFETMRECNLRLVVSIAKRAGVSSSRSRMDIIQDGVVGLRRAIQKYDPSKGFKFSTYATFWIRQSISRGADITFDIRLPAQALQNALKIQAMIQKRIAEGQEAFQDDDLLEMGFTKEEIDAARHHLHTERFSLDKPLGDESNATVYDLHGSDASEFDTIAQNVDNQQQIADLIECAGLSEREQLIVTFTKGIIIPGLDYNQEFLLGNDRPRTAAEIMLDIRAGNFRPTLEQVGDAFGLTRERVRQLVQKSEHYMLLGLSMQKISHRLLLDAEEAAEIRTYFTYGLIPRGQHTEETAKNAQARAAKVLDLLGMLDQPFEEAIKATLSILATNNEKFSETTVRKIEHWLLRRFGVSRHQNGFPVTAKSSTELFKLDSHRANLADATCMAVLAGLVSAPPKRIEPHREEQEENTDTTDAA